MTQATVQTIALALEVANEEIGKMADRLAEMEAASAASEVEIIFGKAQPEFIMPSRGTACAPGAVGQGNAIHAGVTTDASTFVPAVIGGTLHLKALVAVFYGAYPLVVGDAITPAWLLACDSEQHGFQNYRDLLSASAGHQRLARTGLLDRHGSPKKATGYTVSERMIQGAASALTWKDGKIASHRLAVVR
jgi:hypothetical protein